jgi:hypothetical protein
MEYSESERSFDIPSSTVIVCPLPDCPRHIKAFGRGSKMYDHVRRRHPDVDIEEVKRLELRRRGEWRGRKKGSGSVSRSRNATRSTSVLAKQRTATNLEDSSED